MEFDLNNAIEIEGEAVEKNGACGGNGECDKKGCSLSTSTSSCSSNSSTSHPLPPPSKIYKELWYACAGPITNLPKKGNVVVYFPQGHLEQAASVSSFPVLDVPTFDLQPQIFCRVVDVELLANKENDEVYTQLTLLPISELLAMRLEGKEQEEAGTDEEGSEAMPVKSTSHMFCKTLTASDTSTHGGFSVPRRAAEDCFPPLDYKEQRPSQELVAKDLHGVEWKFRHIYRGQPRRHLLTTGWSVFVSQKNLVSGDAVLFLRGDGGDLRLGVRRASGLRNGLSDSVIKNQHSYPSVLAAVANAVSTNTPFKVFYGTRANHADFIVPYHKYAKSIATPVPAGTRFKISVDLDDAPERRYSGVVTGFGDMEPHRWLNSRWRCLMVRWDEDVINHHDRVSPWEIDFSAFFPTLSIQTSPRLKKLRTCMPADVQNSTRKSADLVLPLSFGGSHVSGAGRNVMVPSAWNNYAGASQVSLWDFAESVGSGKVLQGQENLGLASPLYGSDKINRLLDFEMHSIAAPQSLVSNRMEKASFGDFSRSQSSITYSGSLDSNCFPKVLQGQEICSLKSLTGKTELSSGIWQKPENIFSQRTPSSGSYPLATQGVRNMGFPYGGVYKTGQDMPFFPYTAGLPKENYAPMREFSFRDGLTREEARLTNLNYQQKPLGNTSLVPNSGTSLSDKKDETKGSGSVCKLFGVPLIDESSSSSRRSGTKVHKQGSLFGRSIDISKLHSYGELMMELEILFSMEGLLRNPSKGWRILYTDSDNDMMVVGDDPWHEFCEVVSKIHIYTQEEVEKMSIGVISEDNRSCLVE